MLARKNAYSYRADIEFGTGIANYFATQLKLVDMEKQKEHLRKAEIKALQSQINPHFLFNCVKYNLLFLPGKAGEGERAFDGTQLLLPQYAGRH